MTISVLTPDRQVFVGSIESVTVPGTNGLFQIKHNHAPLVSSLQAGMVKIEAGGGEYSLYDAANGQMMSAQTGRRELRFHIQGGFVEVLRNEISLLVRGVSFE